VSTAQLKTLGLRIGDLGSRSSAVSGAAGARLAHAGITVPDLEEAVAWYEDALGLRCLPQRVESSVRERPRLRTTLDEVYDEACDQFRVAFLVDGDSVAVELFEFNDGEGWLPPDSWQYRRAGLSHLGFLVADVDDAAARIVARGGRRRTRTMSAGSGDAWRFCFCEDPYGTVIELQTHSQEEMYGGD
jgi:catechol 2,3-dioxygenase-like lactoylglutathione lyase family enzyme